MRRVLLLVGLVAAVAVVSLWAYRARGADGFEGNPPTRPTQYYVDDIAHSPDGKHLVVQSTLRNPDDHPPGSRCSTQRAGSASGSVTTTAKMPALRSVLTAACWPTCGATCGSSTPRRATSSPSASHPVAS